MPAVRACTLPACSLLGPYVERGAYTDCYVAELGRPVTHGEFVAAFYTTRLFKVERWLLANFLSRPSTDAEARALAEGSSSRFAAWSVERRAPDQIVLAAGQTRSWLMVAPTPSGGGATQLYFGSAVVPGRASGSASGRMGWQFRALLGFHTLYSRALLAAAARKLVVPG